MISILAHRGLWRTPQERNSLAACERALALGFGIEVDVRDAGGALVVAHDVAEAGAYPFEQLCALLARHPGQALAINIKSAGLACMLQAALARHGVRDYFAFDMAVPDLLDYLRLGVAAYTRQSEYEPEPVLLGRAQGVWIDMFERDRLDGAALAAQLADGRGVALVSPELHGREHAPFWERLKMVLTSHVGCFTKKLSLCTDHPEEAADFFHGQ